VKLRLASPLVAYQASRATTRSARASINRFLHRGVRPTLSRPRAARRGVHATMWGWGHAADIQELLLGAAVNEPALGSRFGVLVLVLHFRGEPPYDQQQLREQAAQKYQEKSHTHSGAVVGLMHL
jgi:hypothetical protein